MIGIRLNNYEIESLLGEGGMGMVYLARHPYMGRRAAVKVLRPELLHDKSVVTRFMEEARASNAIQHPNIIDIIDVGFLPDTQTPYLMMEFLDGESLAHRLERARPLPIPEAIEIACQTASALEAAHAVQIVHRDLKPDNLFLIRDPSRPFQLRVKVLDFGIAKLRGDMRMHSAQTKSGILMGTPFYMSPEQCRGLSAWVNHRSDIYSLGVIVYEMLCGSVPFSSEGVGDVLVRHMTEAPRPLRSIVPGLPEALDRVVLRALAKEPDKRFDSMTAFSRALRDASSVSAAQSTLASAATLPAISAESVVPSPAANPVRGSMYTGETLPSIPTGSGRASGAATTLSSTVGQVHSERKSLIGAKRLGLVAAVAVGVGVATLVGISITRSTPPTVARDMVPNSEPPSHVPSLLDAGSAAMTDVAPRTAGGTNVLGRESAAANAENIEPAREVMKKVSKPRGRLRSREGSGPSPSEPSTALPTGSAAPSNPADTKADRATPPAAPARPHLNDWGGRL